MSTIVETPNPHAISNVACQCGCDTLMTVRCATMGRKYLYGHRPADPLKVRKHPKDVRLNVGPEQIQSYFAAQIELLRNNSAELKREAQDLLTKAKLKIAQAKDNDEQIAQLETVKYQTQSALGRIFKNGKVE